MLKSSIKKIWPYARRRLPDSLALRVAYRRKLKRPLNLKNPRSFTEKIQWLKLHYRKPIMQQLADKFAVREFVAQKIGPEVLNTLYGVWDRPEEITYDSLPEKFVLKVTSGSHGNLFCRDKSKFDRKVAADRLKRWLVEDFYEPNREWVYKGIKARIIAEQMLDGGGGASPPDYKFYCFDGEPKFVEVAIGRSEDRSINRSMTITLLDMEFKPLPFWYYGYPPKRDGIEKPNDFGQMTKYAKVLSAGFPFSRIDFYSVGGKTIFGEVTFYPGAGFAPFQPLEWDEKVGEMMKLPGVNQ